MITSASNTLPIKPVLFIIFNRPETTQKVFDVIRLVKPSRLYIAADGYRKDVAGEEEKCIEARNIVRLIDWDCHVVKRFRNENSGCGRGVCEALNWFFEKEESGIILEDDCLPDPSFFQFCTDLLHHYRNDTRIMGIGGNNFEKPIASKARYSYHFSSIISIWGWATWRRAWMLNDFYMQHYPHIKAFNYLKSAYNNLYEKSFYQYVFAKMYKGDERTNSKNIWDFQWQFACTIHAGLLVVPDKNLIINLGLGLGATNTTSTKGPGHDLRLRTMHFPMLHPEHVMVNVTQDSKLFKRIFTTPRSRIKTYIKSKVPAYLLERLVSHEKMTT